MENNIKRYRKKLHSKLITFYLHEEVLFNYAQSINFQKFVKDALRKEIEINEKTANL